MDMNSPQQPMMQKPLPNGTAVLVLGICSIVGACLLGGIPGLTCGIIALVLAGKDRAKLREGAAQWTEGSAKNLNAGRVCAIIGTALSGLMLVFVIIWVAILGSAFSMLPWREMMNN